MWGTIRVMANVTGTVAAWPLVDSVSHRHLCRVEFTGELLQGLITEGWEVAHLKIDGGLPRDAVLVGCDSTARTVSLLFEHPSFPECQDGDPIPNTSMEWSSWDCQNQAVRSQA